MPFGRNVDPPKRGRPLKARDLQRLADFAQASQRIRAGSGLGQSTIAGISQLRLDLDGPLFDVKTTSAFQPRTASTGQMGTGNFKFQACDLDGLLSDAGLPEQPGFNLLGIQVPSGVYGVVVRISGTWRLIAADCSGVS